ncbi:MAG TPA: hypothetical protein VFH71_02715 [Rhodanobacteraceae bacterium]|nr:hypothetical protein [Rhodanobacteraceae bacterium]
MNDTDVSRMPHKPSRAQRLIAAWRGLAQLGMLLDGRAHTWSADAAASGSGLRKSTTSGRTARAPRLARLAA